MATACMKIVVIHLTVMSEHTWKSITGVTSVICAIDRSFFLKQALIDHTNSTGHKAECYFCNETFYTNADLHLHLRENNHYLPQQQFSESVQEQSSSTESSCSDIYIKSFSESSGVSPQPDIVIENDESPVSHKGRFPHIFKGSREGESLNKFMERLVRPSDEYIRRCENLVNRLKKFMEHNTKLHVKKVFVAGSVGKMTNISKHSDVDLIVFIDDYSTMKEFKTNLKSVLEKLERHVQNDLNWAKVVTHKNTTPHAVQFEVKLKGYDDDDFIQVDLLPALVLFPASDELDEQDLMDKCKQIYEDMKIKSSIERRYYSVCFAEIQAEFVKSTPRDVRDLIRLLKYWKYTEHVPVTSCFLEYLVIYLSQKKWEEAEELDVYPKVKEVVFQLKNIHELEIKWPDRYTSTEYDPLPKKPVLLDPMNPFINVSSFGNDKLKDIVEKSTELLNRMNTKKKKRRRKKQKPTTQMQIQKPTIQMQIQKPTTQRQIQKPTTQMQIQKPEKESKKSCCRCIIS